jgi:hypothetical protein
VTATEVRDAFDLPDWVGTQQVVWHADHADRGGHHVRGRLCGPAGEEHDCDLLAVDQAFPVPVVDEDTRRLVHQAWRNGQVLLVGYDGRLALATPGTDFGAGRVMEMLDRLARAVGAPPGNFVAALRVGVIGTG